jgi:hypothetical protein
MEALVSAKKHAKSAGSQSAEQQPAAGNRAARRAAGRAGGAPTDHEGGTRGPAQVPGHGAQPLPQAKRSYAFRRS